MMDTWTSSSSEVDTDDLASMDEYDNGQVDRHIAEVNLRQPLAAVPLDDSSSGAVGNGSSSQPLADSPSMPLLPAMGLMNHSELNLSEQHLVAIPDNYTNVHNKPSTYSSHRIRTLNLHANQISTIPCAHINRFSQVHTIDLSNNILVEIPEALTALTQLTVLTLTNNHLTPNSFPKSFSEMSHLRILDVGGNRIDVFPGPILELTELKALYMGANRLTTVPTMVNQLHNLQSLYLGGNRLRDIPDTIGDLKQLTSLVLCDNRLDTIPSTIAKLDQLESLSLHNNKLTTLPPQLVRLRNLHQLSLRSNPFVVQFVQDMELQPSTLMELAGRVVKLSRVFYDSTILPREVVHYLDSANECVNPKCKGVYFTTRVEHVKFVDFCGKYRVPLLQYLCSPKCTSTRSDVVTTTASSEYETESDTNQPGSSNQLRRTQNRLRKVLLG